MAVSKRTRYEVLKRDNHTCRYCHAIDSLLVVDHVTPVALGGSDDPSNLVAACRDCNAGKASTRPDDSLVEDVRQDALRHAELLREAYKTLVRRLEEMDEYIEEWLDAWAAPTLPVDWRNTIGRWFEMGVPVEIPRHAAYVASTRTTVSDSGRFSYMCGIVWNQVQMVDELAEAKRYLEGHFASPAVLEDVSIDSYLEGCRAGRRSTEKSMHRLDPVSAVVDHIAYPVDPWAVSA